MEGGERTGQLHVTEMGVTAVLDDATEALFTLGYLELPKGVTSQIGA